MKELIDEVKRHIFIIFGSDHYNTLGALRSIGEFGGTVDLILHPKYHKEPYLVNNSRYSKNRKIHYVNDVEEGFRLLIKCYSNYTIKPFLITCDDWSSCYIDEHFDIMKDKFYFFGGSCSGVVNRFANKYNISLLCQKYGIDIPKTKVVNNGDEQVEVEYPIITKSISSTNGGWKSDVYVCYSQQELLNAYENIKSEQVLLSQFICKKHELNIAGFSVNNGRGGIYAISNDFSPSSRRYVWPFYTNRAIHR